MDSTEEEQQIQNEDKQDLEEVKSDDSPNEEEYQPQNNETVIL
jgi:hypothetical protein